MNTPASLRAGTAVLSLAMAAGLDDGLRRQAGAGHGPRLTVAACRCDGGPGEHVRTGSAGGGRGRSRGGRSRGRRRRRGGFEACPARPPAPDPLVGPVTRTELESYETWKTLRAQDYTPDPAAVQTIGQRGRDVRVLAIVATWCPDSKREVPRFFKIYDQAGLGTDRVTMVGVDRSKKDAEGLTVKYQILRVPTFVFFRGDREIGRVTERAVTTLEQDIAAILTK